jgi:hypothetical protein
MSAGFSGGSLAPKSTVLPSRAVMPADAQREQRATRERADLVLVHDFSSDWVFGRR